MRILRFTLTLLITIWAININAQTNTYNWKIDFYEAKTEDDFNKIVHYKDDSFNDHQNAILLAYQGVSLAATAQFVFLPTTKYSVFKDGVKLIETSIQRHKTFENVLLRLVVQLETPSFLGYTQNIEEDLIFLINQLPNLDTKTAIYAAQLQMVKELENDQINDLKIKMLKATQ